MNQFWWNRIKIIIIIITESIQWEDDFGIILENQRENIFELINLIEWND